MRKSNCDGATGKRIVPTRWRSDSGKCNSNTIVYFMVQMGEFSVIFLDFSVHRNKRMDNVRFHNRIVLGMPIK